MLVRSCIQRKFQNPACYALMKSHSSREGRGDHLWPLHAAPLLVSVTWTQKDTPRAFTNVVVCQHCTAHGNIGEERRQKERWMALGEPATVSLAKKKNVICSLVRCLELGISKAHEQLGTPETSFSSSAWFRLTKILMTLSGGVWRDHVVTHVIAGPSCTSFQK